MVLKKQRFLMYVHLLTVKVQAAAERISVGFHPGCTCPTELSEKSHFVVLASYVGKDSHQ